jgi:hypothetical protein
MRHQAAFYVVTVVICLVAAAFQPTDVLVGTGVDWALLQP